MRRGNDRAAFTFAPEKKHAPDRRHEPTLMWDQKSEGLQIWLFSFLRRVNFRTDRWERTTRKPVGSPALPSSASDMGHSSNAVADRKPSHFVDQLGVGLAVRGPHAYVGAECSSQTAFSHSRFVMKWGRDPLGWT